MAVDIFQMNAKKADGTLAPFYPVVHQKSVINGMAQAAVLMTNTQAITTSGYYQYSAATTNLPTGIPTTGYISASFVDPKNGLLMIQGTLWSRQLINGSWGQWQELSRDVDTGWIPVPLKNGSTGDARVCKIGKVVYIEFTATGPTAGAGTGGANTMFQLPVAYRPGRDLSLHVGTNSATAEGVIRISNTTGEATMWRSDNPKATHNVAYSYRVGS